MPIIHKIQRSKNRPKTAQFTKRYAEILIIIIRHVWSKNENGSLTCANSQKLS